jgi:hypothetical protein
MNAIQQASRALRRAIDARSDHAQLVSITSRRTQRCGVTLVWRDYLTREQGTLLAIHDKDIQEVLEVLIAELQEWRAASPKDRLETQSRRCSILAHPEEYAN